MTTAAKAMKYIQSTWKKKKIMMYQNDNATFYLRINMIAATDLLMISKNSNHNGPHVRGQQRQVEHCCSANLEREKCSFR